MGNQEEKWLRCLSLRVRETREESFGNFQKLWDSFSPLVERSTVSTSTPSLNYATLIFLRREHDDRLSNYLDLSKKSDSRLSLSLIIRHATRANIKQIGLVFFMAGEKRRREKLYQSLSAFRYRGTVSLFSPFEQRSLESC